MARSASRSVLGAGEAAGDGPETTANAALTRRSPVCPRASGTRRRGRGADGHVRLGRRTVTGAALTSRAPQARCGGAVSRSVRSGGCRCGNHAEHHFGACILVRPDGGLPPRAGLSGSLVLRLADAYPNTTAEIGQSLTSGGKARPDSAPAPAGSAASMPSGEPADCPRAANASLLRMA